MTIKTFIKIALLSLLSGTSWAGQSMCPEHYPQGQAPDILSQKLLVKARELCFDQFVVMHSGQSRTPLWSAEHLTRASVTEAQGMTRVNSFHEESRLPSSERAELSDYARTGWDRGHMSPSGDMSTARAQDQSFTLANMIPQNPDNNRYIWEGIESAVRSMAKQRGDLYVITGPLFQGETISSLQGRVLIPTRIFKVIYDPKRGEGAAYVVENRANSDYQVISIAELESMSGIDLLPSMPAAKKREAMRLPAPTPHGRHVDAGIDSNYETHYEAGRLMRQAVRAFFR